MGNFWLKYMDFFIIVSVLSSFIIFLTAKIVIFRLIRQENIVSGLIYATAVSSILHFMIFGIFTIYFFIPFFLSLISYFMFILLDFIFIMAIVGIVTTSLRIQLLIEIYKMGRKGILYNQLLKSYNRKIIVRNRLNRLKDTGDVEESHGYFHYKKKFSYFRLHTFAMVLLGKLYKRPIYKI